MRRHGYGPRLNLGTVDLCLMLPTSPKSSYPLSDVTYVELEGKHIKEVEKVAKILVDFLSFSGQGEVGNSNP